MVLGQIRFDNFDRAVSYLSIWNYYLEGFVEDEDCSQRKYEVYNRAQHSRNPLAYIYRAGFLKFVEKNISKKEKKVIEIALSGEIKKEKTKSRDLKSKINIVIK